MHPANYIEFDGSDRTGIEIGNPQELGLVESSFTIEFWANPAEVEPAAPAGKLPTQIALLASSGNHRSKTRSNLHLLIRNEQPYLGFYYHDAIGDFKIKAKKWYHLAFVYDMEKKVQVIYVNGKKVGESKDRLPFIGTNSLLLGAWPDQKTTFKGKIGRLRIWDKPLGADQLKIYKDIDIFSAPDLNAYWRIGDNGSLSQFSGKGEPATTEVLQRQVARAEAVERDQQVQSEAEGIAIEDFIKNAQESITKARERMTGTGFSLGTVHLDFKVIPQENGGSMMFPTPEQMEKTGTNLSTLRLDFEPPKPEIETEIEKVLTPNVMEMTEIMARRQLAEVGLKTEIKYQITEDSREVDRVVFQRPGPNNYQIPGATIEVFIGKAIIKNTTNE